MSNERKLAAIMFTDIVGYTALMGSDEDSAFEVLGKNREIHSRFIEQFNGTLIKEMGDGMLISFNLASDAVRCAIEIQKECKQQDIPLKIGIHEGEMVFKGADVLGDGVNIASRLQEDAPEGCIIISASVYRDIKNKVDINTEFIGEKSFKNVDEPIKVYMVFCDEISQKSSNPLISKQKAPKKKSIIVLPFENMSPDPDQEYFSDGLTEEIITDLSHIHDLLVISRNSAMTFKGSGKTTKEIAAKVNVRYVLEGSVRKAGNNLRITAQLIDGINDSHIWAEKYSGTLEDVFEIQEKVSKSIADALKFKLSPQEKSKIIERPIDDIGSYVLFLKADAEIMKGEVKNAIRNLKSAQKLIIDNKYIYTALAWAYWMSVNTGAGHEKDHEKAFNYVKKAMQLDPEFSKAHAILGWLYMAQRGDFKKGIKHFKKALEKNPNENMALRGLGVWCSGGIGKFELAMELKDRLQRIDPMDSMVIWIEGAIQFYNGNFQEALSIWTNWFEREPLNPASRLYRAMALIYCNDIDEGFSVIDKTAEQDPHHLMSKFGLIMKYSILGEKDKVYNEMTQDYLKSCNINPSWSQYTATFLSMLNEKEAAIEWLEKAVKLGFIIYPFLAEHDPFLKNIRGEERFKKLMKKVKYEWENFEV